MIIECVGIHHTKQQIHVKSTNFLPLRKVFIVIGVHAKETNPYARVNCMKCPQTSHVEGDQFLH